MSHRSDCRSMAPPYAWPLCALTLAGSSRSFGTGIPTDDRGHFRMASLLPDTYLLQPTWSSPIPNPPPPTAATATRSNAASLELVTRDDQKVLATSSISRDDGLFHFEFVPNGDYILRVSNARDVTWEQPKPAPNAPPIPSPRPRSSAFSKPTAARSSQSSSAATSSASTSPSLPAPRRTPPKPRQRRRPPPPNRDRQRPILVQGGAARRPPAACLIVHSRCFPLTHARIRHKVRGINSQFITQ